MSDLRELYQEVILDHYRTPRNYQVLEDANHRADGHNPLCGDKVSILAQVEDGVVRSISFEGAGCAISTASASLMTEAVAGQSLEHAKAVFEAVHHLLKGEELPAGAPDLGKLEVLSGVRDYPVRVKCATLAWHTLMAALDQKADPSGPVTTE